jgi:hypothetical protein
MTFARCKTNGDSGTFVEEQKGSMASATDRTAYSCSARSFEDRASEPAKARSLASSPVLLIVPARTREVTIPRERRSNSSGVAPTKPEIANPAAPLAHVDLFVRNTGADVRTGEPRAYYVPSKDFINMPERSLFTGSPTSTPTETYYSTLLHELSHWTGAPNRLNRDKMGARFGNEQYAAEELVAELSAAFLCADLGIANDPRPDHAQYIQNWLTVLKNDARAIFVASSKAQAAASFLHGLQVKGESVAA